MLERVVSETVNEADLTDDNEPNKCTEWAREIDSISQAVKGARPNDTAQGDNDKVPSFETSTKAIIENVPGDIPSCIVGLGPGFYDIICQAALAILRALGWFNGCAERIVFCRHGLDAESLRQLREVDSCLIPGKGGTAPISSAMASSR